MAVDQRDHYIERLRERTGYTERASFRVPLGRPRWIKPTGGMGAGRAIGLVLVAVVLVLWLLSKLLRG